MDRAARDGRTVVLLGCEGGDVQTEPPVHGGLSRFGRAVVAECNRLGIVVDCAHASFAATMAVLQASGQPVIISHGQLGHADTAHPRLLTTRHATAVASGGGLIGAWPCGLTSRSLADFGTEIIRLTEAAGLLRDRGLTAAHVRQVLGGNAADLLNRTGP
ncbi:MAG: membrane dipeptidase [Streptosporangiaceae bacterium]